MTLGINELLFSDISRTSRIVATLRRPVQYLDRSVEIQLQTLPIKFYTTTSGYVISD